MEFEHVLVVDDDPRIREAVRNLLRAQGTLVAEAATGVAAMLALTGCVRFDVVVLDLLLPPPSGLRVIALVRAVRNPTPFVLITGLPDDDLRAAAAALGGTVVLGKPFSEDALLGAMRAARELVAAGDEAPTTAG